MLKLERTFGRPFWALESLEDLPTFVGNLKDLGGPPRLKTGNWWTEDWQLWTEDCNCGLETADWGLKTYN